MRRRRTRSCARSTWRLPDAQPFAPRPSPLALQEAFVHPDIISLYRSDAFNKLDFVTFHLMTVAVLLAERSHAKVICWSLTTTLAWLRLLRVRLPGVKLV